MSLAKGMMTEGRGEEALSFLASALAQLSEKNTELELRVSKLLREKFGRKSEKVDSAQLALFLSQLMQADADASSGASAPGAAVDAAPAANIDAELPKPAPKPRKGHGRRPLPQELPREVTVVEPPETEKKCAECNADKVCIGHESSEMLELVPASFKVLVTKRLKYACKACAEGVVIAPAPARVIDNGLPGPGLLAQVLVGKYKDALPLHRQREIFLRSGVDLAVSTLADWVAAGADALSPVAREIQKQALLSHVLQSDDTGLKVLDKETPNGIKRGHVWVYLGDGKWAAFVYTPDWKGAGPQTFLEKRKGWVLVDGYAGYDALFTREGATAVEAGCMAHARRGFVETLDAGDIRAAFAIELFRLLYAVERKATEEGVDAEERKRRRQAESWPILEKLGHHVADILNKEPPKTPLAKAAYYVVNQWEPLKRFLEDGLLPIDNSASERALKTVALGRKNFLFAGSDAGGERAATLYTLIGTCTLNGVDPWSYLKDVLEKLAAGWHQSRIAELLPPTWMKAATAAAPASTAPETAVA